MTTAEIFRRWDHRILTPQRQFGAPCTADCYHLSEHAEELDRELREITYLLASVERARFFRALWWCPSWLWRIV